MLPTPFQKENVVSGDFHVASCDCTLLDILTVGAEEALKLGQQANQVKLLQKAFVLHSCVQPHDKTTG